MSFGLVHTLEDIGPGSSTRHKDSQKDSYGASPALLPWRNSFHSSTAGIVRKWTVSGRRAKDKRVWIWCYSLGTCLNLLKFIKLQVSVMVLAVPKHLPRPSLTMQQRWQRRQTCFAITGKEASCLSASTAMAPARSFSHPCESFKHCSASWYGAHALNHSHHGELCPGILLRSRKRPLCPRKDHESHRGSIYR